MKKQGHPEYREVLFVDSATGTKFICGTTLNPQETEEFNGKRYPVYRVSISSASHPFFTGSKQFIDTEGRVDKFRKRYAKKEEKVEDEGAKEEAKKEAPKKSAAKKTAAKTVKKK